MPLVNSPLLVPWLTSQVVPRACIVDIFGVSRVVADTTYILDVYDILRFLLELLLLL